MRVLPVVSATAVLVLATGCGGAAGTSSGGGEPSGTAPDPPALPAGLELRRSGGFAGFDDRLTVAADGTVALTRRGGATVRCVLEPALRERVAAVPWAQVRPAAPAPGSADRFTYVVRVAGHEATLAERDDLDATQTAALETAAALISAAASPRAGGGCRPA